MTLAADPRRAYTERAFNHLEVYVSPRSAELNRRLREESRARIVAHALDLFARHGYEATTVRMIAAEAGVAQGLLYTHFRGKDDLLRAIVDDGLRGVAESFAEAAGGGDAWERLERLVRASFVVVRRDLRFWRLSYAVRMQPPVLAGVGEAMAAAGAGVRGRMEAELREGGSPRAATEAALLFALIDGVAQHYALDPERYPLDEAVEGIVMHLRRLASEARRPLADTGEQP